MSRPSRRAWWELLRIANVFTSASNVAAGHLTVHAAWSPWRPLLPLVIASCFMYAAGMVLNDAFDACLDACERPERPIPSGRIRRNHAFLVGWTLLAVGVASAAWAAWSTKQATPFIVALCLALTIVLYDGGLKKTWAGPFAMGWCRTLNVLLGASSATDLGLEAGAWGAASAVGLYTLGLTWLARSEVTLGSAASLRRAGLASVASVAIVAAWGRIAPHLNEVVWFLGIVVMLRIVGGSPWLAVWRRPCAADVRAQVGRQIVGFLVMDAWIAALAAGWPAGLAIAASIVPMRLAARRAPMT